MSSQLQNLQKEVEQLRVEASIPRIAVSKSVAELIAFIQPQMVSDMLVHGMPQKENPFRDHPTEAASSISKNLNKAGPKDFE